MRDFPPGEALPDCETYRDCGVEVTTGSGCRGDDGEGDADCKSPADLEDATKRCGTDWIGGIEVERGNGCNTWEAVELSEFCLVFAR